MNPSWVPDGGPCTCYECVGPDYRYSEDGHRWIHNNLKAHTLLEPCGTCGRLKTEYLDLGRKGYFTCWWCRERAGEITPVRPPAVDALVRLRELRDRSEDIYRRMGEIGGGV